MRVAVDFQSAQGKRSGIGNAANDLMRALRVEAPDIEWLLYSRPKKDLNSLERIVWESIQIPIMAWRDKADLIYSPGFGPALLCPIPSVVTVHDIIGLAFPQNQKKGSASHFYWSVWQPACLKRARRLVASSENTRRDLERLLSISSRNVDVIPLGASEHYVKKEGLPELPHILRSHGIQRPYMICVGTFEPRKNHQGVLKAMSILKRRGALDWDLVLVGKDAGTLNDLKSLVASDDLAQHVHFLGYTPDDQLISLYNGAMGYVMISLYEGFGLPALEAMRCGLSGVVSDRSSLPEITGETALLVDPENVDHVAEALERFRRDEKLRRELASLAYDRAKIFSYQITAKKMVDIFRHEAKKKQ